MKVEVCLFASFTKYLPSGAKRHKIDMEFEAGTTVEQVLVQLHVPLKSAKLIFINGVHAEIADILKEGDRMGAFPPVAGG